MTFRNRGVATVSQRTEPSLVFHGTKSGMDSIGWIGLDHQMGWGKSTLRKRADFSLWGVAAGEWVIPLLRFELGEVSLSERQCTSQIGLSLTSHLTLPTGHYCWAQYACIMQFNRKIYFISGFHFEFLAKEESLELLWPNYCFVLKWGSSWARYQSNKGKSKTFQICSASRKTIYPSAGRKNLTRVLVKLFLFWDGEKQ